MATVGDKTLAVAFFVLNLSKIKKFFERFNKYVTIYYYLCVQNVTILSKKSRPFKSKNLFNGKNSEKHIIPESRGSDGLLHEIRAVPWL